MIKYPLLLIDPVKMVSLGVSDLQKSIGKHFEDLNMF